MTFVSTRCAADDRVLRLNANGIPILFPEHDVTTPAGQVPVRTQHFIGTLQCDLV